MSKYSTLVTVFIIGMQVCATAQATHRTPESLEARLSPIGRITFSDESAPAGTETSGGPTGGPAVYDTSCAACHGDGVGGAPVAGDPDDWEDRIEQGLEMLTEHAIQGYQGASGVMPARGGNPNLSDAQVTAAVEYMVALLEVPGTPATEPGGEAVAGTEAPSTTTGIDGEAVYDRSCVACHTSGVAGSPRIGDASAWAPRLAQGMEILIEHAIRGFQGSTGVMPAKGGNPALSDEEVAAAVQYMVEQSR